MERKLAEIQSKLVNPESRQAKQMVSNDQKNEYAEMKEEFERQLQQEVKRLQVQGNQRGKENIEVISDDFEEMSQKFKQLQKQ